ncbi:hypothetical protein GCM10010121_074670 [Streptomyces brasiliensis]|uniref:Uncharacterized protein n=1 Tax=Streptomyces brasiliensis TaxID=1954 RepID=A0A917L982_9ACTN|nr:hypothetical protein GCM10010121_074670 [Streptomyces brasiliensis]
MLSTPLERHEGLPALAPARQKPLLRRGTVPSTRWTDLGHETPLTVRRFSSHNEHRATGANPASQPQDGRLNRA